MTVTAERKRCSACGQTKPLDEFPRDVSMRDGHDPRCLMCNRERGRAYRAANLERERERVRERDRAWYAANPERARERAREKYAANPEPGREHHRRERARLRAEVFSHYGDVCACPGCGATEDLTIDHIDGSGGEHRQELFGKRNAAGVRFYEWLIKQGFPDGYQTLCRLCNRSKASGERCRLNHAVLERA